jgi:cobalt/nickel transport system permease protein
MHMADSLLSPAVGGAMWAASAATIAFCSAKIRSERDDRKPPLMGVLGAFVFAAQMINFSIPGTGSSGHLGGGLLLAVLLGPCAALLTIASVLFVQALFFADGGLLALGCNIFNMGIIPAFIVFPLCYRKMIGQSPTQARLTFATLISAIIVLQLGPLAVVIETLLSGISALPFATFLLLMQPVHLVIGVVEGFVTVAVVSFVSKARPQILQGALQSRPIGGRPLRGVLLAVLVAAIFTGGFLSMFASSNPDSLEWAIAGVKGTEGMKGPAGGVHAALAALQENVAFLPGYSFGKSAETGNEGQQRGGEKNNDAMGRAETGVAGIVGGVTTLGLAFLIGFLLKKRGGTTSR